jgi:hypothetical protein
MDYNVPETKPLNTGEQQARETVAAETETQSLKTIASRLEHGEAFVTNFDGNERERYKRIATACGSGTIKSNDSTGKAIDIKYYFAHRVPMEDSKTGEYIDQLRIVLVDKEDKYYSFVSAGIADSLNLLIGVFGNGPWTEPMEHKIAQTRTNADRNMLSLAPV